MDVHFEVVYPLAVEQGLAGEVDGDQGGGAGRVDRQRRSPQPPEEGETAGGGAMGGTGAVVGVDPVAIGRAAVLNATRGRVVSGGSQRVLQDYRETVDKCWGGELGTIKSINVNVGPLPRPCNLAG